MADMKPMGIDQTTGQQRPVADGDNLTTGIGDTIEISIKRVGDYSGNAVNQVQVLHPWGNPVLLDNATTLPASGQQSKPYAFSPNGEYLAYSGMVGNTEGPVFQLIGTGFHSLATPSTVNSETGGVAWSKDGTFLTIGRNIFQRDGSTFTELSSPASIPASNTVHASSWSPNGEFVAFSHSNFPFINIQHRDGTTFTKLADPASAPRDVGARSIGDIEWSPDGRFLVIGIQWVFSDDENAIYMYELNGAGITATLDLLPFPATTPGDFVRNVRWSNDGLYLAVDGSSDYVNTSNFTVYKRSGTTLTKLNEPSSVVGAAGAFGGLDWSPNGRYLAVAPMNATQIVIYEKNSDDSFTLLDQPSSVRPIVGALGIEGVTWHPSQEFIMMTTPTIGGTLDDHSFYQTGLTMPDTGIVTTKGFPLDG